MLNFFIGVIVGGAIGIVAMCFVTMAGAPDDQQYSEKQQSTKSIDSDS